MTGPAGPAGPIGATGPQGPTGATGATGPAVSVTTIVGGLYETVNLFGQVSPLYLGKQGTAQLFKIVTAETMQIDWTDYM